MSAAVDTGWIAEAEARLLPERRPARPNLRGDLSRADWRFVLPALDLRRVLILGSPAPGLISALADSAEEIIVGSEDPAAPVAIHRVGGIKDGRQVRVVRIRSFDRLPFASGSMDLLVGCAGVFSGGKRFRSLAPEAERVLAPTGSIYFETTRPMDALHARVLSSRWAMHGRGGARLFWTMQHKGETRAILPMEDASGVSGYLFDRVFYGLSRRGRWLRSCARALNRFRILPLVHPRRGVLLQPKVSSATADGGPVSTGTAFDHIMRLGEDSGIGSKAYRAALFSRGNYNSNKVALFLFPPGERVPEIIVKMTRAAAFNGRLEAEYRSLRRLQDVMREEEGTFPAPLFLDYHGGLAVVGQRAIDGVPFRTRTTHRADCPFARAAIEWMTRLAASSVDEHTASSAEVASVLTTLYHRFNSVYNLPEEESRFLEEQIRALSDAPDPFPLVIQHGDTGTWNVLVTKEGRIAFLDWESSVSRGLPLWDLFYFLRSFGTWTARLEGERDRVKSYFRMFLAGSPFSELQERAATAYWARIGMHPRLAAPLFYTCWMHRALKEASWSPKPPEEGHYVNLLRLCIRERDSEGMRWLRR